MLKTCYLLAAWCNHNKGRCYKCYWSWWK